MREFDILYPLLTSDQFGPEYRMQLLQLLSLSGGQSMEEQSKRRITFFPFFFYQRSSDPRLNYTALAPFYGRMKNRMLRDEIEVFLFPLYSKTMKREVVTRNFAYPFFHLRTGDQLTGWQFWPMAGHEKKLPGTRTNSFGEAEPVGGHEKRFAAWPFFFHHRTGIGTTNPVTQTAFLPIFSRQTSPSRQSISSPWPLGWTHTVDRQKKFREWGLPWPLVLFAHGEGKTARRIWPLFGQAKNPTHQSDFYLWPVWKFNRLTTENLDRTRIRIGYILYSDLVERNRQTGEATERTDLWPLFTARRDSEGNERFQMLALLEPVLSNNKSVERNFSPLWSLWRSEKNEAAQTAHHVLLWNFFRHEKSRERRHYSFMFGLFQLKRGPGGTEARLFNIPIGRRGSYAK